MFTQKHTKNWYFYTMVEWHTNRNVFRSILDYGQIRMIRSQTVKMPATAYLNVLMLSTVTDDDWFEKTRHREQKKKSKKNKMYSKPKRNLSLSINQWILFALNRLFFFLCVFLFPFLSLCLAVVVFVICFLFFAFAMIILLQFIHRTFRVISFIFLCLFSAISSLFFLHELNSSLGSWVLSV